GPASGKAEAGVGRAVSPDVVVGRKVKTKNAEGGVDTDTQKFRLDPTKEPLPAQKQPAAAPKVEPEDGMFAPEGNNAKFEEVAKRLSKVFGKEVKVSKVKNFNGIPNFEMKVGETKADAELVIDQMIEARNATGLSRETFPLKTDDKGNII